MDYKKRFNHPAFTIVELLVVIVVIAILAAITIVSYTGISSKAIASSLQSDLNNASKQLKLYQIDHSNYPTSLTNTNNNYCPSDGDTKYCIKSSNSNTYNYAVNSTTNPQSFYLTATNNSTTYKITSNTKPSLETSPTTGLVGQWSLDNDTGITDLSFNNNNGTPFGNMNIGTAVNHRGVANGASAFDGSNDYVDFVDTNGITKNNAYITISYWIKLNVLPATGNQTSVFLETNANNGYTKFSSLILSNGSIAFYWRDTALGSSYNLTSNAGSIATGNWYFIANVLDTIADTQLIYVNNNLVKSGTLVSSTIYNDIPAYSTISGKPVGWTTNEYINGFIDDVRIYNRALSQSEITQLYNL